MATLPFLYVSSALDMSIIGYNIRHGQFPDRITIWLVKHGKNNNVLLEKEKRFDIFKDNLRFVDEHNSVERSYYWFMPYNQSLWLFNVYRARYFGTRTEMRNRTLESRNSSQRYLHDVVDELAAEVDWRVKGLLLQSKMMTTSCWAFSTFGPVEGINQIVTGDLISLSEQELVDCDKSYNKGCNGGLTDYGGIDAEKDYPDKATDNLCDPRLMITCKNAGVVTIHGYEDVPENDENSLKRAVAHQPISVAIEADGRAFQLYQSIIYLLIFTMGWLLNDKDYWIVSNSCSPNWGEDGYVRMERNVANAKTDYPPNPSHTTPSPPAKPSTVCDDYYSCFCFSWGCGPLQSPTCCDYHFSCCPHYTLSVAALRRRRAQRTRSH
ncbi:hypothetical protein K2173_002332 [Erythroxylum novogranatense]|uniref:Peptidase C1A papain C-terminal domain-containing protein n=1 Tax=Erythroxylum novogranatense TaxID=1862640 RepID=A0AAV8TAY2_9ROSI|nr:hypothetical protein K2173_002332 [Erythroxylum novogranatense]